MNPVLNKENSNKSLTTSKKTKFSLLIMFGLLILGGLVVVVGAGALQHLQVTSNKRAESVTTLAVTATPTERMLPKIRTIQVKIANHTYELEIADNNDSRAKGLAGRKDIGSYDGMIFVFDKPDRHGFWMKDTFLALDMIWVDEKMTIISKQERVLPESYPKVFYPSTKALYVIEFPAETLRKVNIKIGDTIKILE